MIQTLVFCDDYWHPAELVRAGLEPFWGDEFDFTFVENTCALSLTAIRSYPLCILAKSDNCSAIDQTSWMTAQIQAEIHDCVCRGSGLLAVHSGIAGYSDATVLRNVLGGCFTHHPPECIVKFSPLVGHPLCAGSEPFTLMDEHYFISLDDHRADVFMTTESKHGKQPGGWLRSEGAGRVAAITPSHHLEGWMDPSFQRLLLNVMRWCVAQV